MKIETIFLIPAACLLLAVQCTHCVVRVLEKFLCYYLIGQPRSPRVGKFAHFSRKMVRAWYMDDSKEDQRAEHHKTPPEFIDVKDLYKITGVEYFTINPQTYTEDGELESIKRKRGYTYEDQIVCSRECLPNYEEKLRNFFTEHLHTDEEIRLCLEGSGYFDVRDKQDQWIRIEVVPGDMIIIPSGIYHRFTLDSKNFIKAKRFFIGEPVWTPHNRPADEMECRQNYLKRLDNGFEE